MKDWDDHWPSLQSQAVSLSQHPRLHSLPRAHSLRHISLVLRALPLAFTPQLCPGTCCPGLDHDARSREPRRDMHTTGLREGQVPSAVADGEVFCTLAQSAPVSSPPGPHLVSRGTSRTSTAPFPNSSNQPYIPTHQTLRKSSPRESREGRPGSLGSLSFGRLVRGHFQP